MPPVRFEPTISAGEVPQTYALGRAATGTGNAISKSFCKLLDKIPVFRKVRVYFETKEVNGTKW